MSERHAAGAAAQRAALALQLRLLRAHCRCATLAQRAWQSQSSEAAAGTPTHVPLLPPPPPARRARSQADGDGLDGRQASDLAEQSQTLQLAVFGVLLTIFRERWEDSKRYVAARVGLEHLQLLLVLLKPHWMWAFNYNHWLWKLANCVLLQDLTVPPVSRGARRACSWLMWPVTRRPPMRRRAPRAARHTPPAAAACVRACRQGEVVYMTVLFVFIGGVSIDILAFAWVGLTFARNGSVANRWCGAAARALLIACDAAMHAAPHTRMRRPSCRPIKLLRLQVVLMYQVAYVTILNYLMGPISCRWLSPGPDRGIHIFFHEGAPGRAQHCMARRMPGVHSTRAAR